MPVADEPKPMQLFAKGVVAGGGYSPRALQGIWLGKHCAPDAPNTTYLLVRIGSDVWVDAGFMRGQHLEFRSDGVRCSLKPGPMGHMPIFHGKKPTAELRIPIRPGAPKWRGKAHILKVGPKYVEFTAPEAPDVTAGT